MDSEQERIENAKLCERFLNGDESAFEELYEKCSKHCMALLMKSNVNFFDAQEVIQKTFIKVWKKMPELKDPNTFKGWLFRICMNTYKDLYVYKKRRNDHISLSFISDDYTLVDHIDRFHYDDNLPSNEVEQKETISYQKNTLKDIFKNLKPEHSETLKMCYLQGKRYKEISDELNIPIGTVMSRIHYGKKVLAQAYDAIKNRQEIH
jgi:RNA polymerase sigma-70 factor (ECF subfamily)